MRPLALGHPQARGAEPFARTRHRLVTTPDSP
jgi:hypothetical protein